MKINMINIVKKLILFQKLTWAKVDFFYFYNARKTQR